MNILRNGISLFCVLTGLCAFAPPQLAAAPPAVPSQFALDGDFTIRYMVRNRQIDSPALKAIFAKSRDNNVASWERILFQNDHQGRVPAPSEAIPPDIQRKAEEEADRRPSELSMTVTLAEHGTSFLYQVMTDQDGGKADPNTAWKTDPTFSGIVLYDGKRSLKHVFMTNTASTVWEGIDTRDMWFMPVFCSRTSGLTLIRSLTPSGNGVYTGNVVDPGNGLNRSISFHDPAAVIHMEYADGKPRITQIVHLDPSRGDAQHSQVSSHMEVTAWREFQGVWLPAQAAYTLSVIGPGGQRIPASTMEWTLLDAHSGADPKAFDSHTYLREGDVVQYKTAPLDATPGTLPSGFPARTGGLTITFNPLYSSVEDQYQHAQALPAKLVPLVADPTNHGDGTPADALLSAAEVRAKAGHKAVLLVFHASWCGPCALMHAFLNSPSAKPVIDAHYVVQEIDVFEDGKNGWENPGGQALYQNYGGAVSHTIPYYVILNPSGKKLADSLFQGRNVGMPSSPDTIETFLRTIRKTSSGISAADLATIQTALKNVAL